jgi:chitodextrinase
MRARAALLGIVIVLGGCVPAPNQPPLAVITASPLSGGVPLTVQFDGSRSRDPDGTIIEYLWDFGDGATASGVKVSHTYMEAGLYLAVLTVRDNRGATALDSVRIKVGNPPPIARLTATPRNGFAPLTVQFDALASSDPAALIVPQRIVRYEWDLGDGTGAFGEKVSHIYTRAGVYTVTLRVFDDDGASDRAQTEIRVLDFAFPLSLGVGLAPTALAIADFDGDGFDDVAVANFESRTVAIVRSTGDGGFQLKSFLALTGRPVALVARDFTGDQKIDLVVANFDEGRIAIFEGQGTGEFRATGEIVVGAGPYALLGADFNDDGIFDIAVANAPLGASEDLRWGRHGGLLPSSRDHSWGLAQRVSFCGFRRRRANRSRCDGFL